MYLEERIMNAEEVQIDTDRNNLVFTLLIVATLMMLCTFLFAFFVLDNFAVIPCSENRASGPQGPPGIQGKASPDNVKTGPTGLSPNAGFVRGPQGEDGDELTGPTGILSTLGTGWPGPPGATGPQNVPNLDGLTEPGILFSGDNQVLLDFYAETEMIVQAKAATFTNKSVDVKVVLNRRGSMVTLNIYPFLIFREAAKTGLQGLVVLTLFNALLPLPEYSPPRQMIFPCLISKFSITQSDGTTQEEEATKTNVDWGGALEIFPSAGCTLYANWSVYDAVRLPTQSLLFQSADSPFGLEGIISFSWLID